MRGGHIPPTWRPQRCWQQANQARVLDSICPPRIVEVTRTGVRLPLQDAYPGPHRAACCHPAFHGLAAVTPPLSPAPLGPQVPIVKGADKKSISAVSAEIKALAAKVGCVG